MKSEKIKREIKKLREEIGKIKDDRIVPYRDFVEGHGEHKYDLHFLKLELRARRMSDMITTLPIRLSPMPTTSRVRRLRCSEPSVTEFLG